MALPRSSDARVYYQAARQRFEDGEYLLFGNRNRAAVYLSGYAVECMLKALILDALSTVARAKMLASFRGAKAHDVDWLRIRYQRCKAGIIPRDVLRNLVCVGSWTTHLRYEPARIKERDSKQFMQAAKAILAWAEGRLGA